MESSTIRIINQSHAIHEEFRRALTMSSRSARTRVGFLALILLVPAIVTAQQQAALSGTISDSTGGVLPGVTVVATHIDTGNTFEAVTDSEGHYRILLRTGAYRLRADLSGFS